MQTINNKKKFTFNDFRDDDKGYSVARTFTTKIILEFLFNVGFKHSVSFDSFLGWLLIAADTILLLIELNVVEIFLYNSSS